MLQPQQRPRAPPETSREGLGVMRPPSVLGAPDSPSVHTHHNRNLPTGRSKPAASLPTHGHLPTRLQLNPHCPSENTSPAPATQGATPSPPPAWFLHLLLPPPDSASHKPQPGLAFLNGTFQKPSEELLSLPPHPAMAPAPLPAPGPSGLHRRSLCAQPLWGHVSSQQRACEGQVTGRQ